MKKLYVLYMLDESGVPVPVDLTDPQNALAWGEWRWKRHQQCVVAQDPVHAKDGTVTYGISTVFTGTNAGGDPPLLWETLITHGTEGDSRYASYASRIDAEVGHQRALAYFRAIVDHPAGKSPP